LGTLFGDQRLAGHDSITKLPSWSQPNPCPIGSWVCFGFAQTVHILRSSIAWPAVFDQ
jgi:hypothetical protein